MRDENLLDSALNAPFQEFDGVEEYATIQQKAARLGYGLVKNHAFVDGNKRIGAHTMLIFLKLNNVELEYKQNELTDTFLKIAGGEYGYEELLHWIAEHQK